MNLPCRRLAVCITAGAFAMLSAAAHPGGSGQNSQDGATPQFSGPIGTPVAPPPPQFQLNNFNEALLSAIAALDAPAAHTTENAKVVRALIWERDLKLATKTLPKHVAIASKG